MKRAGVAPDDPRRRPLAGIPTQQSPAILGGAPAFERPVYLTRPRVPNEAKFAELVSGVFRARWFTNDGALVQQLEQRLRDRLGAGFCTAVCNGTVGLQVALRALDLDGEVITTPFTFPATVHAIMWNGLTPVFCDIDPDTYNLDVQTASELVSDRTCALLPVHVFGNPCDVMGIQRLTDRTGLKVVYDAAHAFGVVHDGRPICCWGDLSVLSFHATKLFHTCEGGAVVGPDNASQRRITLLRNFGIVNEDEVRGVGLNGKLSELHAAMGLCLLDAVDEEIQLRGERTARYDAHLAGVDGLRFQRRAPGATSNHAYYTIEIDPDGFGLSRDQLYLALRAENVLVRKYFHPLCSENEAYRSLPSADPMRLPNAHRVASRILSLPLYADLALDDVDKISECILAIKAAAPGVRAAARSSRL
jgi:dTDP-4-amino-4,6-dideoxygalactose transaminase